MPIASSCSNASPNTLRARSTRSELIEPKMTRPSTVDSRRPSTERKEMRSSSGVGKACWGSVRWSDDEPWAHLRLLSSTLSHTTPSKSSANTVLVVGCFCVVVVVLTGSADRRECIVFQ